MQETNFKNNIASSLSCVIWAVIESLRKPHYSHFKMSIAQDIKWVPDVLCQGFRKTLISWASGENGS